jgi:CubicO group peptidase (beta-lactamase class C family)
MTAPSLLALGRAAQGPEDQVVPGLAWASFSKGAITGAGAFGLARLDPCQDDGRCLMAPDTKMRVASVSKLATAAAVMRLVEQGKLALDEDISVKLGFAVRNPAHPDAPITLRHLLSHTSSMRDADVYWGGVGGKLSDFFTPGHEKWCEGRRFAAQPPGTYFAYCNLAFGVMGTLVERATGERFDRAAKRLVFDPLGLDCGFNWSGVPAKAVAHSAALFRLNASGWVVQADGLEAIAKTPTYLVEGEARIEDYKPGTNGTIFNPQGGLRASVLDLARLGMAFADGKGRVLKPATLAVMETPAWTDDGANGDTIDGAFRVFGLGLHIETAKGPIPGLNHRLLGHYGDAYGLKSALLWDPDQDKGFAYAVNGTPEKLKYGPSGVAVIEEIALQALHQQVFG